MGEQGARPCRGAPEHPGKGVLSSRNRGSRGAHANGRQSPQAPAPARGPVLRAQFVLPSLTARATILRAKAERASAQLSATLRPYVFYLRTTNFVDESPLNPHFITEILSDIISLPVKVLQQLLIRIGDKNPNSPPRLRPLVIWPMPCLLILPVPPQANLTPTSVPLHC